MGLKIDEAYAKKYDGSMISKKECDLITAALNESNGSYLDFSDSYQIHPNHRVVSVFRHGPVAVFASYAPINA